MERSSRSLKVVFGIIVLGSLLSLIPQNHANAEGGAPINIMSPLPLPVTGNVTANISLPNPLPVSAVVSNAAGASGAVPLVIQDSENPARTAFDVLKPCFIGDSATCMPGPFLLAVPAGQIAVIESASGSCSTDPGVNIEVAEIVFNGSSGNSEFFLTPGPAVLETLQTVTPFIQNLKAYAFGGANESFINFRVTFTGPTTGNCKVAISGHMVTP